MTTKLMLIIFIQSNTKHFRLKLGYFIVIDCFSQICFHRYPGLPENRKLHQHDSLYNISAYSSHISQLITSHSHRSTPPNSRKYDPRQLYQVPRRFHLLQGDADMRDHSRSQGLQRLRQPTSCARTGPELRDSHMVLVLRGPPVPRDSTAVSMVQRRPRLALEPGSRGRERTV